MTRYAFTGTADVVVVARHADRITRHVQARHDGTEFTTGAQVGIDSFVMYAAMLAFPEALHRVIVPAAPHDEEAVQWAYEYGAVIVHAPPALNNAGSYRARNQLLIAPDGNPVNVLVAVARHEERRDIYCGAWATTRLARNAGIPVIQTILEPAPRLALAKGA